MNVVAYDFDFSGILKSITVIRCTTHVTEKTSKAVNTAMNILIQRLMDMNWYHKQ